MVVQVATGRAVLSMPQQPASRSGPCWRCLACPWASPGNTCLTGPQQLVAAAAPPYPTAAQYPAASLSVSDLASSWLP